MWEKQKGGDKRGVIRGKGGGGEKRARREEKAKKARREGEEG